MRPRERLKQWRAAERVEAQAAAGAPRRAAAPQADAANALAGRALAVAGGNPGLQEILCRPLLAGELDAAAAAIGAVEGWKGSGQLPQEENAAQEFFQRLAFATYKDALTESQRTQLRAATLFSENLPVPLTALAAAGRTLGVADPAAALPPLAQAWRDADGDFPFDARGVEAARLALAGAAEATLMEAAAYPAGYHLFNTEHNAQGALALLQPALTLIEVQGAAPRPDFLRLAADCAQRVGETGLQIALLEQGLALPSDDQRAMAQLAVTHAEATLGRDGPEKALERLHGARAVFEALGDVRSRAVTMGQIADILQQQGETAEALRILLEECLPIRARIQDVGGIAYVRYACARIRLERGGLQGDEGQTIIDELAESFTLFRKLQRVDGIAVVGSLLGQVLAAVGLRDEALTVLDYAAAAFDRLQQAAHLRALQARLRAAE